MTVDTLIEELRKLQKIGLGEKEVCLVSNYGDRCSTQQALEVVRVRSGALRDTCYSDSGKAFVDWHDVDDEIEDSEEVIGLLSR